ncbi:MAG: hybrid sensor histidine kinase/response regulator [Granulosicoccus sp.]
MNNQVPTEVERLKKINTALIEQVERSMDQQGTAYSLFQTAINLDRQIRHRTVELTETLADLEQSNKELTQARDFAEHANLSKTRFLAAASHDVLQPLNAALLLMSSLLSLQTDDEARRLCGQVERSLDTMDSLLRALLYMSRLDAGDVQPRWQSVSVDALFDSMASDFEPMAKLRNLELRVRHSGLHVRSDPTMLRRILQNIVTNALRYTERGGVLLIAGQLGHKVHIRIADTGIGIERERFKEIFMEFNRGGAVNNSDEDSSTGLGLGLAIVERMVNTLGHRITLNSRLGHGSCFGLCLPTESAPSQSIATSIAPSITIPDATSPTGLIGTRILVIENDLIALQAMDSLLKQWGCGLRLASSTQEALDALDGGKWIPDLVIADQHLNGNDRGTTALRAVYKLIGHQVPAVVVTAVPGEGLWKLAEQGQIEVMPKPIKPAQLRALLTHLRSKSTVETHR